MASHPEDKWSYGVPADPAPQARANGRGRSSESQPFNPTETVRLSSGRWASARLLSQSLGDEATTSSRNGNQYVGNGLTDEVSDGTVFPGREYAGSNGGRGEYYQNGGDRQSRPDLDPTVSREVPFDNGVGFDEPTGLHSTHPGPGGFGFDEPVSRHQPDSNGFGRGGPSYDDSHPEMSPYAHSGYPTNGGHDHQQQPYHQAANRFRSETGRFDQITPRTTTGVGSLGYGDEYFDDRQDDVLDENRQGFAGEWSTGADGSREYVGSGAKNAIEWIVVLVGAVLLALLLRAVLLQAFWIPSPSMESTLEIKDRVLVNKLSYRLHDINRGDVVVFRRTDQEIGSSPDLPRDVIKRVIGLPGETIEARDDTVIINGETLLDESSYIDEGVITEDFGPVEIPEGHVFVMGDNRQQSLDSRFETGPVATDRVVGRAFFLFWPLNRVGPL